MRQTRTRIFGEDGYTLIELTVAVAILATLTIWGMESFLARRPAELGAAVREVASKLGGARALALANAGGFEAADGAAAAIRLPRCIGIARSRRIRATVACTGIRRRSR